MGKLLSSNKPSFSGEKTKKNCIRSKFNSPKKGEPLRPIPKDLPNNKSANGAHQPRIQQKGRSGHWELKNVR